MKKLILISLLLVSYNLLAQSIGTVLFSTKNVIARNNGSERTISRGSPLNAGDTIVTAAEAVAKIRYLNGTLVTIGPNSEYTILSYAPKQGEVINAKLSQGKIESDTNGGETRETLQTPVVALAINGTKFKVYVSNDKKTNVQLISGKVKVGTTSLKPGESVVATSNGVYPAPFPKDGTITITPAMQSAEGTSNTETTGIGETTFITTTLVAAVSTTTSTAPNAGLDPASSLAILSIECFPSNIIS